MSPFEASLNGPTVLWLVCGPWGLFPFPNDVDSMVQINYQRKWQPTPELETLNQIREVERDLLATKFRSGCHCAGHSVQMARVLMSQW